MHKKWVSTLLLVCRFLLGRKSLKVILETHLLNQWFKVLLSNTAVSGVIVSKNTPNFHIGFVFGLFDWLEIGKPPISRLIALSLQALVQAKQEMHSRSSGDSLNLTPMGQTS